MKCVYNYVPESWRFYGIISVNPFQIFRQNIQQWRLPCGQAVGQHDGQVWPWASDHHGPSSKGNPGLFRHSCRQFARIAISDQIHSNKCKILCPCVIRLKLTAAVQSQIQDWQDSALKKIIPDFLNLITIINIWDSYCFGKFDSLLPHNFLLDSHHS